MQEGVKTKWVINGIELNSYNNYIILSDYRATLALKEGENIIEFTPVGDFMLQCPNF